MAWSLPVNAMSSKSPRTGQVSSNPAVKSRYSELKALVAIEIIKLMIGSNDMLV